MKKILLSLFIITTVSTFAQTSVCGQYHRKYCRLENSNDESVWIYNAQSKSGLFNQGMTSKIRCVVYKGMDYRINVCCEVTIGNQLNYKIFDARTNELLYDNSSEKNTPLFEFQSTATRQLIIELTVPKGETQKDNKKPMDAACVGLLIEHKVTSKQGF